MMDAVCPIPPISSSCGLLLRCRCCALLACSLFSLFVKASNTRQENSGLKGQPCGNPSSCRKNCACLFSSKYHCLQVCCVNRSNKGTSGVVSSCSNKIFLASVLLTLLNIFVRSSMTSARLGGLVWLSVVVGVVDESVVVVWLSVVVDVVDGSVVGGFRSMYCRTAMAVVWATKSTPPGTCMPYWPPWSMRG